MDYQSPTPQEKLLRRLYLYGYDEAQGGMFIDTSMPKDEGTPQVTGVVFWRALAEAHRAGQDYEAVETACWDLVREANRRGWSRTVIVCGIATGDVRQNQPVNLPGDIEILFGL